MNDITLQARAEEFKAKARAEAKAAEAAAVAAADAALQAKYNLDNADESNKASAQAAYDKAMSTFCALERPQVASTAQKAGAGLARWEDTARLTANFFSTEYKNKEQIDKFLTCLQKLVKDKSYYGMSCAVVQSSGCGKSRLLAECSNVVPVFYVCNRKDLDTGYPPCTKKLVHFFENVSPENYSKRLYARCVAFCMAVMASSLSESISTNPNTTKPLFVASFDDSFCKHFLSLANKWEDELFNKLDIANNFPSFEGIAIPFVHEFFAVPKLLTKVSLIICLDEARYFHNPQSEVTILDCMIRASRVFHSYGVVIVHMDTLNNLRALDHGVYSSSSRAVTCGKSQLIYSGLATFDVHWKPAKFLEETVELKYLQTLGRPLWYNHSAELSNLIEFAQVKLCGTEMQPGYNETLRAVALLGNRVWFDISPHHRTAKELVSSHMAHLDYIDSAKRLFCASYISDPVLSIAAADTMARDKYSWNWCMDHMIDVWRTREISSGQRGELIAQLICTRAADLCAHAFPSLIGVRSYLLALLNLCNTGDNEAFLDAYASTEAGKRLLDGKINLTHFIRVEDYCPNREDLLSFLERGAGVVCKPCQKHFDLIIPILMKSRTDQQHVVRSTRAATTHITRSVAPSTPTNATSTSAGVQYNSPTLPPDREFSIVKRRIEGTEYFSNINQVMDALVNVKSPAKSETAAVQGSSSDTTSGGQYLLRADNVSYILIQVKNHMSSSKRDKDFNLDDITPIGNGLIERLKEKNLPPYVFIGMYFNSSDCVHFHDKVQATFESKQCPLNFALLNPHLGFDNVFGDALDQLLKCDPSPADMVKPEERNEKKEEYPLKYNSYVERYDLNLNKVYSYRVRIKRLHPCAQEAENVVGKKRKGADTNQKSTAIRTRKARK